ncbi:MAG: hypothetical protein GWO24_23315, partial [Akkermansiaceae bacterium]|nr:hypothetical protein [Akkermansiaceae bacterium]
MTEAELDTISWWINQGAPERMSLDTDLPSDEAVAYMETEFGFPFAPPKLELLSWEEVVAASEPLQGNPDVRIRRVALDSPELDVFFEPTTNNVDELLL